jgi:hypothetical protein
MFQITQIEFSERAPAGCRQYYQGSSGVYIQNLSSFAELTTQADLVFRDFILRDFALTRFENLHHFLNLRNNFLFNAIWHR